MGFSGRQSHRIAMRQVARLVDENARVHHAGFTKTSNPACELAQDKPVNNLHAGVAVIEAGDRGE